MAATTSPAASNAEAASAAPDVRVAIVGAGFSGLGMAIRLLQHGIRDFVVLERGADVGGTWRDNTYPGCACDIPAHLYSFSFAPNPAWSRVYATQPEIWAYLRACVKQFALEPYLRCETDVTGATWDDAAQCWRLATSQGPLTARALVFGNGPLSEPSLPAVPGIESFAGTLFHSARWDHAHDLAGERVAVIGTGASAIQFVPHIQPLVGHLTLFMRTPPWIVPRLDGEIPAERRALYARYPLARQLLRGKLYLERELRGHALMHRTRLLRVVKGWAVGQLTRQVPDAALRTKLTPSYTIGCKRILISNDFYPALAQPNVTLETAGMREVRPHSIVTSDGREIPVDTIICATGFHVTDMPAAAYVRGRDGRTLAEVWRRAPEAYLGTTVAGFPNLFLQTGPNTGLGHNSMIYMIESQLSYILGALRLMERRGLGAVEVRPSMQAGYNREVQRRLAGSVWNSGCQSWYLHASGRNSSMWPGQTWEYRRRTRRFDPAAYVLTEARAEAPVA
ncbi:MAG TPA: NAD(P)/FAD-dependent oxidoreductase [Ktedonobacterales bacterium]|nr:NAD(P)/FAD-dependent oxidoreductase [Ktedonobacterales bacterium]